MLATIYDIADFISIDDPAAAEQLLNNFEIAFRRLSRRPKSGRARDEIAPGLRSITVGAYIVFYKIRLNVIEIVRVVSGYRDLPRLFK